jgi:diaminohydroxyphosphoribosylaminopyrimidine deaminase / 5-amino-6-(5-phosphoribosylamino)uracil reductase
MSFRERVQIDPSMQPLPSEIETLDETSVWELLRAVSKIRRSGTRTGATLSLRIAEGGRPEEVALEQAWLVVELDSGRFESRRPASPAATRLLEMYLPLCVGSARPGFVFAHLGQSLDGQIATSTGNSQSVSGPENIRHLHRLRALCDAVMVGASTVEFDDPQLTTRLVPGDNPARVVIDPRLRLPAKHRLFQDPCAPTIVICDASRAPGTRLGHAEILPLAGEGRAFSADAVIQALFARGLRFLFVEGGGVTVSRFFRERALDRLHVTVSPLFLGQGRPGIVLPAIDEVTSALRPSVRHFALGDDVLFDCKLG